MKKKRMASRLKCNKVALLRLTNMVAGLTSAWRNWHEPYAFFCFSSYLHHAETAARDSGTAPETVTAPEWGTPASSQCKHRVRDNLTMKNTVVCDSSGLHCQLAKHSLCHSLLGYGNGRLLPINLTDVAAASWPWSLHLVVSSNLWPT